MINSINPIETIRNNLEMYLGVNQVIPARIASFITEDIFDLGGSRIILENRDNWYSIAADIDWLKVGHQDEVEELFKKFFPLKNGRLNSFRREILLSAFARDVATYEITSDAFLLVKGKCDKTTIELFLKDINKFKRILVFRI